MAEPIRIRGLVGCGILTALLIASCSSGTDAAAPDDEVEGRATTSSTVAPDGGAVGGDLPDPAGDPPTSTSVPDDDLPPDQQCVNFRTFIAADAPCSAIVRAAEAPSCVAATGSSIDCSAVPRIARIAQVSGAVISGQPLRPDVELTQYGRGPGPTNTSLVVFTDAPVLQGTEDQLEIAVVYESPGGPQCDAAGEAWDRASFVSVLRLGPGPARVTDLGCRPDGFAEISQRSTWFVSGDLLIVHLPIDLPGSPARVTGTFRAAPAFVFDDGRIMTRRVDPGAWKFDAPIDA